MYRMILLLWCIMNLIVPIPYVYSFEASNTTYTITSKTLTYVPEKASIFLKENVRIVSEAFVVTAQEVDVLLEKQQENTVSFSSENIESLLFRRNVTFIYKNTPQSKAITGKGNSSRYDVKKEMLYMYGDVIVETDGNTVEGDEVVINLATNTVQVQGNNKKPVEVFIKPRKEQ